MTYTLKDLKEFAEEELKRIKDGSDDPLRDFEALRTLCDWCIIAYDNGLTATEIDDIVCDLSGDSGERSKDKAINYTKNLLFQYAWDGEEK